tara:strand:+ start:703 stop:1347 length:645 start_codon:yes stop_codon:yes gene_type:complete
MSEIRVTDIIGENGTAAVNFSKGINISSGVVTATSFVGSGANLTGITGGGGKVLQYVYDSDNTEYANNTGTTYTAVHGSALQLSITPAATSSKILVMFNWGAIASYQASCLGFGKVMYSTGGGSYQNITPVGSTNDGQGGNTQFAINLEQSSHAVMGGLCYSCIHHPNTTQAIVYRPYFKTEGSGGHIYINRNPRNNANDVSGVSWAYALELAG